MKKKIIILVLFILTAIPVFAYDRDEITKKQII